MIGESGPETGYPAEVFAAISGVGESRLVKLVMPTVHRCRRSVGRLFEQSLLIGRGLETVDRGRW